MRNPKDFFRPLAVGAPAARPRDPVPPVADDPLLRPEQREDGGQGARHRPARSTSCSATSRTPSRPSDKEAARAGLVEDRQGHGLRRHPAVDPGQQPRLAVGARRPHHRSSPRSATSSTSSWSPRSRAPRTSTTSTGCSPSSRPRPGSSGRSSCTPSSRPPAAWPTSRRSARASPRMQGLSLGPADLAANRRMKTTRVGGGHPGYLVRAGPDRRRHRRRPARDLPAGPVALHHRPHGRRLRRPTASSPYYGPFGDIKDVVACEDQFRNAFLLGCVGAWSLHPVQIDIAKRVFSPDPADVRPRPPGRSTPWATAPAR